MMIKLHDIDCDEKVVKKLDTKSKSSAFTNSLWNNILNIFFVFNMLLNAPQVSVGQKYVKHL